MIAERARAAQSTLSVAIVGSRDIADRLGDAIERRIDACVAIRVSTVQELFSRDVAACDVVLLAEPPDLAINLPGRLRAIAVLGAACVVIGDDLRISHRLALEHGAAGAYRWSVDLSRLCAALRAANATTAVVEPVIDRSRIRLSLREQQTLAQIVAGHSIDGVARALGIGRETVRSNLRVVRCKARDAGFAAPDRDALVALASILSVA